MRTEFINWEVPPFAIFSAENASLTAKSNAEYTARLRDILQRSPLDYAAVSGCYNGIREQSFIVLLYDDVQGTEWAQVMALARSNDQESVLYVDSDRHAFRCPIDFPQSPMESLGAWVERPQSVAIKRDGFTIGPDGRYWVCEDNRA